MFLGLHHISRAIHLLALIAGCCAPQAMAELVDPAPTARVEVYFKPGGMAADPLRDVVYVCDDTNNRILAYDSVSPRLVAAAALDGAPSFATPTVTRDGAQLWLPLPSSNRIQKLSLPELMTIDLLHVGRAFYSVAEGADGNIYAVADDVLYQIDANTGSTLSVTDADSHSFNLLRSTSGGEKLYLMELGSTVATYTYEEFTTDPGGGAPTRIGFLDSRGHQNDTEFVIDELHERLCMTGGGIYGVNIWNLDSSSPSHWPYGDAYGNSICMLPSGDSIYACNDSRIRRFRRSDGTPLYDYDDIMQGDINARGLEITPNGHLHLASTWWTGNSGRGIDGYIYYMGSIGTAEIGQVPVNTAPVAVAGADQTIPAETTVTLAGSVSEAPGWTVPAGALFGHWKLDGSGADSSGNNRHATVAGAEWVAGRHGQAAKFSSGGVIDIRDSAEDLESAKQGAICLWFKTEAAGDQILFACEDEISGTYSARRLRFLLRDGVPRAEIRHQGGLYTEWVGNGTFNDGEWHHAALVTSNFGSWTTIYIDAGGVSEKARDFLDDAEPFNRVYFGRGRNADNTADLTFEGELDDLRIYTGELPVGGVATAAASAGPESITQRWRKISGPGLVTFVDETAPTTTAEFSVPGDYVLELEADDGALSARDRLHINVDLPVETLLQPGAPCQWSVPNNAGDMTPGGTMWYMPDAITTSWQNGTTGVGYERSVSGTLYTSHIGAGSDVEVPMYDSRTSALIRIPVDIDEPAKYATLTLRMKYDDGFVCYLNGSEIARRRAPDGEPAWDAEATSSHDDDQALEYADIDVSGALPDLKPGANLLAIHGLNRGTTSSDFLIMPSLVAKVSGAYLLYQSWASDRGLTGTSAALMNDGEGDGLYNIDEYVFVSDPGTPDTNPFSVTPTATPGMVELSYRRLEDYAERGISYLAQASSDLREWEAADSFELEVLPGDNGSESVRIKATAPPGQPGACYWRIVGRLTSS